MTTRQGKSRKLERRCLILLPTYNERANIRAIIDRIYQIDSRLDDWILEVLVIDDNSPDGTGRIVKKLQIAYECLYLITGQKAGLGRAYLRGFNWGISRQCYDAFIQMDADLSHKPSDIPRLLKALADGANYVIGSRYISGGAPPSDWPLARTVLSRSANFIARYLVGLSSGVKDATGGFKAISADALERVDLGSIDVSGYFTQVSLLYEFWQSGLVIKEIPIKFADRRAGKSKLGVSDILEFLIQAYRLNPSSHARQIIRFALVGATGTIVNLAVLHWLIRYAGFYSLAAVAVAIEVSIISNFLLNHFYTFHFVPGSSKAGQKVHINLFKRLLKFNFGMLTGAGIQFGVFALLHVGLQLEYLLADFIAILIATGFNYFFSTRFVWRSTAA